MRCRVCRHPKRVAIEAACEQAALENVAGAYALSERALERHMELHARASGIRLAVADESPATLRSGRIEDAA